MRAALIIAVHDLRLMLTERAAFIVRLLMPIAFIFVIGIANDAFQRGDPTPPVLLVADLDGSALSGFYSDYLARHADDLTVTPSDADPERALESGEADFAVLIPEGFEADLSAGRQAGVRLTLAVSDPQQATRLQSLIDAANQRITGIVRAGEVAAETVRGPVGSRATPERQEQAASAARARASDILLLDRIVLDRTVIDLPDRYELIGFQQSVPGMGSMFVMLWVLAGATLLIDERRRYTLQRTVIAPVSRAAFVGGKILGRFIVGMMQYLIAIATGMVIGVIFGIDFGSSPLLMLTVMISFALCVSAMSILIATVVRRTQQASGLETLLAVTLAPIGGAWWSLDIEIVPEVMRKIALISPFYWVMEGFKAAIHNLGWQAAALPIAVLLGLTLLLATVGAVRFRFE